MLAAALGYHRARGQAVLVGALRPAVAARSTSGPTPATCSLRRAGEVRADWHKEGRQRLAAPARCGWSASSAADRRCCRRRQLYAIHDGRRPPASRLPGHACAPRSGDATIVESRSRRRRVPSSSSRSCRAEGRAQHDLLPMALTPTPPPPAERIDARARTSWRGGRLGRWRRCAQPGLDLLRRLPPRTRRRRCRSSGAEADDRVADAITAAVLDLDRSYLGVQGPPGTGKTYVGAAGHRPAGARARLAGRRRRPVARRRRELARPGRRRRRRPGPGGQEAEDAEHARAWTEVGPDDLAGVPRRARRGQGCVLGGTAWDLTSTDRIGRDAARPARRRRGRAVLARQHRRRARWPRPAAAARRPAAAPAGQPGHPPRAGRRLRARLAGRGTTPVCRRELGYFLGPHLADAPGAVRDAVSRLSYDDQLRSNEPRHDRPVPGRRRARRARRAGRAPGQLAWSRRGGRPRRSRRLVGRARSASPWATAGAGAARPLGADDILVVAPYNAQVALHPRGRSTTPDSPASGSARSTSSRARRPRS